MITPVAVLVIGGTIGTVAALTIHRWFDRRDDQRGDLPCSPTLHYGLPCAVQS